MYFTRIARHCWSTLARLLLAVPIGVLLITLGLSTPGASVSAGAEVFIAGFTNGCFGVACAPSTTATAGGLSYSNSTFQGTTANGFRGIGGNANPGSNFNNLGSVSLSTAPQSYNTPFTLQVTFTAPQGITGSNSVTFTSTITGTVRSDNTGGVFLDFDNTPVTLTFSDTNCEPNPEAQPPSAGQTTCGNGSFNFSINDVSIDPGQTVSLTGQVTGGSQQPLPTATPTSTPTNIVTSTPTLVPNRLTAIAAPSPSATNSPTPFIRQ